MEELLCLEHLLWRARSCDGSCVKKPCLDYIFQSMVHKGMFNILILAGCTM